MSPVIYFEKGFTDRRLDKGFRSGTGPILVADRYPETNYFSIIPYASNLGQLMINQFTNDGKSRNKLAEIRCAGR